MTETSKFNADDETNRLQAHKLPYVTNECYVLETDPSYNDVTCYSSGN
jgi:hypothetical protein